MYAFVMVRKTSVIHSINFHYLSQVKTIYSRSFDVACQMKFSSKAETSTTNPTPTNQQQFVIKITIEK
jgi:hypothetical protein